METLDLHEAADFLKLHPEVLRRRARAGQVPAAKVGRCWVFLHEDLVGYLAQAKEFHASKGEPFHSYVGRKVKAKARKYNTIENQKNMVGASRRLHEEAEAYQREKDGDDE